MKRNYFIIELIKSPPFIIFIIITLMIVIGVIIGNRKDKAVQMKEDILYVAPKPK